MPESTQIIEGVNKKWILRDTIDKVGEKEVWTVYDFSLYLKRAGLSLEHIIINPMTRVRFLNECVHIFKEPKYSVRFLVNPDPSALENFTRGIERLMALDDPRIAKIYDYKSEVTEVPPPEGFESEEAAEEREKAKYPPFYVMDWIKGDTLKERASRRKVYEGKIHESLVLIKDIGAALVKTHKAGISHSELKPKKIFVKPDGNPVIIDFGISQLVGGKFSSLSGVYKLEDHFLPPELTRGSIENRKLSEVNDVYSLGKLLYYLISGGVELPDERHHDPVYDLRMRDPSRMMQLVYRLFDRTITSDPSQRIQTVDDLLVIMDREMQEGTTCIFCHKGKYKPMSQKALNMFWHVTVEPGRNDFSPRLLVCDNCGNVQNFVDTDATKDGAFDETQAVQQPFNPERPI